AKKYWEKTYHWTAEVKKRKDDLSVYEQFGQQSAKINHLHELKQLAKSIKQEIGTMKNRVNEIHDQLDDYINKLRINQRQIETVEDRIKHHKRQIDQITIQKTEKEEERIVKMREAEAYKVELAELQHLIPQIVEEALESSQL